MVRINNREYAWGNITVFLLGRAIYGITGIEYTSKRATEARFGAGIEPKSIQRGRREYEGTITLMQSEVIALNKSAQAAGYRDILDADVDIVVSYLGADGIVSTDRIVQASFSEMPKGMKEGDLQSEHAMPFVCLDIQNEVV
jgi:hypothetical protein